jgi:hypothetical protein
VSGEKHQGASARADQALVHGETKATCLRLKNLPPLVPTSIVDGRNPRVWRMGPGPDRKRDRSRTLDGIGQAMAEQWGGRAAIESAKAA